MPNYNELTNLGAVKLVKAGPPGVSEPVTSLHDIVWDSTTNTSYTCLDPTLGSQQWSPAVVPSILSPTHPDLVAMYTMDNISGSILVDETGNGNDGTLVGAPVTASGLVGSALNFDKVDDRVSMVPKIVSSPEFSVSTWTNISNLDAANGGWFINQRSSTGGTAEEWQVIYYEGFYRAGVFTSNGYFSCVSSTVPVVDTWRHLVFTFSGTSIALFVNGVPESTVAVTGTPNTGSNDTRLGMRGWDANPVAGNNMYGGLLDQLRVFNRALTQQEVTELYNEGTP